jgi:hypothetical protein
MRGSVLRQWLNDDSRPAGNRLEELRVREFAQLAGTDLEKKTWSIFMRTKNPGILAKLRQGSDAPPLKKGEALKQEPTGLAILNSQQLWSFRERLKQIH